MKAISVRLPWAFLLVYVLQIEEPNSDGSRFGRKIGLKDVENRGWGTEYRGRLAIHAGKTLADEDDRRQAYNLLIDHVGQKWADEVVKVYRSMLPSMPGHILGTNNLMHTLYRPEENEAGDYSIWHMHGRDL